MYTDFILGIAAGFAGAVATITIIGTLRSNKLKHLKYQRKKGVSHRKNDYEIPYYDPRNDRW
ncbi:hypothetical protein ACJD0Z_07050 [Flavobacteriaceae bacterium M23B6Z8]